MEIPPEALNELKETHFRLTGERLTNGQATAMGQDLFGLFLSVYEPLPTEWVKESQEEFNE